MFSGQHLNESGILDKRHGCLLVGLSIFVGIDPSVIVSVDHRNTGVHVGFYGEYTSSGKKMKRDNPIMLRD